MPSQSPSKPAVSELESFVYKPKNPAPLSNDERIGMNERNEHPATPMPQKIPLSELISNTPRTAGTIQNVSPEEKVVWKLTPKKMPDVEQSPSRESSDAEVTKLLNLLNEDKQKKASNSNYVLLTEEFEPYT